VMFCDRLHCEKANGRLGGVGKETQIIFAEVYSRVDQTKFLPIFRDVWEDGSPLLPTWLKSRLLVEEGADAFDVHRISDVGIQPARGCATDL